MQLYELVKDIERYGERVYEKELDKYSKIFAYQYEHKIYIIAKYRGEIMSVLKTPSIYVEL